MLVAPHFLVGILGAYREGDSAAGGELRGHDRFARRAGLNEIVENAVRDRFVERALVSIRGQIKFQGLALDAEAVGHVIDIDAAKIGLPCYRTDGSEIVSFKMNPIIPAGRWIWKSLKARLRWRSWDSCFGSSEQR